MANITSELSTINNNPYGEEVRDAIENASNKIVDSMNSVVHSSLFRGKELGSGATFAEASTEAQRTAIQNGTFNNLFVGDYWTIDSKVFRIADFDYWYKIGDTSFDRHHLVIVPDAALSSGKMNDTNITTGAYVGSKMYTDESSALNTARTTISNLFGNYLGTHRSYLANAVTNGAESAGAWIDSSVDFMSEIMVYGCHIRTKQNGGSYIATSDKSQLALFKIKPEFIVNKRTTWWLRDVVSSTHFAGVAYDGVANAYYASGSISVRPCFPLVVPSE